jgi:23S rRNA (uracil1939-C5)-methyltransferase
LAWQLIEAGTARIEAPCKIADRCGGCDFMALSAEAQRAAKCGMLREAMRRTGGFRELPAGVAVKSIGPSLGYRTRVRLHIDEQGRLGLFARGTHDLIELDECLVCHAGINDALRGLRRIVGSNRESVAEFEQVEIRVPEGGEHAVLVFAPRAGQRRLSPAASALLERLREAFRVSVAGSGGNAELIRHTLPGGLELHVPASSFEQVNWSVNRALVARVVELSTQHRIARFVELYAGSGNFTLPLLASGTRGVAIEGNAAAASALAECAASSGYDLAVLTGDVRQHLAALRKRGERADLVLLDPPRAGARDVLGDLIALAPAHVAFCSCDPVTLARDLRVLRAAGFELSVLEGYDMFPQTHHLESLAWLSRR